jgi:dephospho-CoA kinase
MHIIGVLGGVASGKSLVARQFAALGAGVLDADQAAHEVLRFPHVAAAARARWGEAIFAPDEHVDRGRLAQIVFGAPPQGPQERKYLEQLTHPEVGRLLGRQAEALAAAGTAAAVLDAPLLLEAGWDRLCDRLVFVDAPREARLTRAQARGWTTEAFVAREGVQESLDAKRARADVVIDNSGSPQQTQAQVERFWQSFIG